MMNNIILNFCFTCLIFSFKIHACTTFFICENGEMLFGKNYDWVAESGMVCTNLRGLKKTSFEKRDGKKISWISKYGSITFNQYGKEFPSGGINEKGLVIELMWLDGTIYPYLDERASIDNLQWIQYQLDNSATIDEVILSDRLVRISASDSPLHYLVADCSGQAATIEFLNGSMVVHKKHQLSYPVLTNNTYEYSIAQMEKINIKSDNKSSFQRNSLNRFATACHMIDDYKNNNNNINGVDYAFGILDSVKQGNFTKWSIVYDLKNMTIYFKTLTNPQIKYLELHKVDFDCKKSSQTFKLNSSTRFSGDILVNLEPFTNKTNRAILENTNRQSKKNYKMNPSSMNRVLDYSKRIYCNQN